MSLLPPEENNCPHCGKPLSPRPPHSSKVPSQGARAGHSGNSLEGIVDAVFSARGVRVVDYNSSYDYGPEYQDMWGRKDRLLIRQVRINGWRVDRLYVNFHKELRVPIECKQQLGGGTTDEKLPHVVDKLIACNCSGFWLVVGGGGFSKKMIHTVQAKIAKLSLAHKTRGHLVFNEGPFLQRAVERLVERGEI